MNPALSNCSIKPKTVQSETYFFSIPIIFLCGISAYFLAVLQLIPKVSLIFVIDIYSPLGFIGCNYLKLNEMDQTFLTKGNSSSFNLQKTV
jgi:hypothetical protein